MRNIERRAFYIYKDGFTINCENRWAKCQTDAELESEWSDILYWFKDHDIKYKYQMIDNALYSDLDEDSWIGYNFTFSNPEDAIHFKLTWVE